MRRLSFILALLLTTQLSGAADIQKLMQETQHMSQTGSEMILVWWIPTEFWEVTFKDNPGMTEEQKKQFIDVLDQYTLISVVACDVGPFGGMTARGRSAMAENIKLTVKDRVIAPLNAAEISPDAVNFLLMFKPALASMLGQFGQSIEFFLYPNEGGSEIRAGKDGGFSYEVYGKRYEWRLPLGSLLPARVDPKTGEEFPGNFRYNPFTGEKLADK